MVVEVKYFVSEGITYSYEPRYYSNYSLPDYDYEDGGTLDTSKEGVSKDNNEFFGGYSFFGNYSISKLFINHVDGKLIIVGPDMLIPIALNVKQYHEPTVESVGYYLTCPLGEKHYLRGYGTMSSFTEAIKKYDLLVETCPSYSKDYTYKEADPSYVWPFPDLYNKNKELFDNILLNMAQSVEG